MAVMYFQAGKTVVDEKNRPPDHVWILMEGEAISYTRPKEENYRKIAQPTAFTSNLFLASANLVRKRARPEE